MTWILMPALSLLVRQAVLARSLDFMKCNFQSESYWAQKILETNISLSLVTCWIRCCSEARYLQSNLKWMVFILFWLSRLMIKAKGHPGFSQWFGWLRDNGVHMIAGQCWPCWAALLIPLKTGLLYCGLLHFFSLHLSSTHCVPTPEPGSKEPKRNTTKPVPQCERKITNQSVITLLTDCIRPFYIAI